MEPDLARILENVPQALIDGLTIDSVSGHATLHHRHIGESILTSGAIVACDPMWVEEDNIAPFTTPVPPGTYPLTLSVAQFTADQCLVAYAVLRCRTSQPIRWEGARFMEEALGEEADADRLPAYGVDTGLGCFMDRDAARVWARRLQTMTDADHWTLTEEMDKNDDGTGPWINISLEPETRANLIIFSAGAGDGGYASYVGYDTSGNAVCLVTDFGVLWPDM